MFRTVLVALIAVFALTAISASSALAAPEWYVKKAGVWSKVTTSVKVTLENSWELNDTKFSPTPLAVSCTGSGEGEIKSAGAGKISKFPTTKCEPAKIEHNSCKAWEGSASGNLPWGAELYSEAGQLRQRLVSGGVGTPDWAFTCQTLLGSRTDECFANTSTHMTNNSGGFVEAVFDATSAKTECSQGKSGAGEWKGKLKFKANQAGVEAIKVE